MQGWYLQQVPPLPMFSGEGDGVEGSFLEWHEQLERVAIMCQWSDQVKLINSHLGLREQPMLFTGHVLPPNEPATSATGSCSKRSPGGTLHTHKLTVSQMYTHAYLAETPQWNGVLYRQLCTMPTPTCILAVCILSCVAPCTVSALA